MQKEILETVEIKNIVNLVEESLNQGKIKCCSFDCTFNKSSGCFISNAIVLRDGRCEYYTRTGIDIIFPGLNPVSNQDGQNIASDPPGMECCSGDQ